MDSMAATKEAKDDSTTVSSILQGNCHFQSLHTLKICLTEQGNPPEPWCLPISGAQTLITVAGKPRDWETCQAKVEDF